ncbi:MAG: hypothetical protein CM1200mP30_33300 [Pseudomonadota bacterium]|nr:MAG: hypothetical protein CM1200mP30_33300 [Pseudomonadota bacterium]
MKEIEFWFSIGSTYTYLSVTRLAEVKEKTGASFSWQPFSVRKIMREMDNFPFPPSKQVKVNYMWRDIERRAQGYGFTANVPALSRFRNLISPTVLRCLQGKRAGVRNTCGKSTGLVY